MKVLVTGAKGQLGYDVLQELQRRNIESIGISHTNFNIADFNIASKCIKEYCPDVVIHCGAYTAVDRAEIESEYCRLVNVETTKNIAKICKQLDCKMIYISTDYVFDGKKKGFYETDDIPNPQNTYGRTKLEGEKIVRELLNKFFIVRTSWAFGINGQNFVKTMLKLSINNTQIKVVADQYGSPTYTYDLASLLCDMCLSEKYGIYHATNEGVCNWAEFAEEIMKDAKRDTEIIPVTAAEYGDKVNRPMNSRLSKRKLKENGFSLLRSWQDALEEYINILKRRDYE